MLRAWCEPCEDACGLHDLNGLTTAASHHHGFLGRDGLGLLGGPQRGEGGSGRWAGFRLEETHCHGGDDREGHANSFRCGFHCRSSSLFLSSARLPPMVPECPYQ